jgi:hypothetical protein
MRKLGWLPATREKHVLVDSLLKFFCVASRDEWERIYIDEEVSVAFRVSLARTQSPHAISAWLRKGEIQAKEIQIEDIWNEKKRDIVRKAVVSHAATQSKEDVLTSQLLAIQYKLEDYIQNENDTEVLKK